MSAMPFSFPIFRAFTTTGTMGPLAGGLLHTFEAGTSTPLAVFQDAALTTPHTNPVVLDSNGQATIYLGPNVYKMRLEDSMGAVQPGWPIDNIEDPLAGAKDYTDTLRSDLAESSGSSLVGFIQSGTGAVATDIQSKARERVIIYDFMSNSEIAAAKAGATPPDITTAITNALALLAGGGILYIPSGRYYVTAAIPIHSGITIQGESNVDKYYGTKNGNEAPTFIHQATANTPVFSIGEGVCDFSFSKLCLSAVQTPSAYSSPTTGKYGIKCEGRRPYSSYRGNFDRVSFYNFERGISVVGVDGGSGVDWQLDSIYLNRCTFWNCLDGVYFNTMNADAWHFDTCVWLIAENGNGIRTTRVGYTLLTNCYAGPAPLVGDIPSTGNDFIHIGDFYDNIKMVGCQAETIDNFLHVDASTGYENSYNVINLDGCMVESPSLIERQCKIVSNGSRYENSVDCLSATAGLIRVESYGDSYAVDAADAGFTPAAADMSGTGTLITIVKSSHGLTGADYITVTGCSTAGYNIARAQVQYIDADTFKYFATGTGTPATAGLVRRYASFRMNPNRSPYKRVLPTEYREWPGSPISALDPLFVGEEVLDTVNSKWYKSVSLASDWKALN